MPTFKLTLAYDGTDFACYETLSPSHLPISTRLLSGPTMTETIRSKAMSSPIGLKRTFPRACKPQRFFLRFSFANKVATGSSKPGSTLPPSSVPLDGMTLERVEDV